MKLYAFFLIVMLSLSSFADAVRCKGLFTTRLSFAQTLSSLAALRLNLDDAQAKKAPSVSMTMLSYEYSRKEKDILHYLEQENIMTRAEFDLKLKEEILR